MSVAVEPDEIQAARELRRWPNFSKHLKIAERETLQMVPFVPNVIQRRLSDHITAETVAGNPIRMIILKARRMGVSTIIQMRMLHRASTILGWTGLTGAHRSDSSEFIHGMNEKAWSSLPGGLQRPKQKGLQGREILFEEGGGLSTFTAGSEAAGRGAGFLGLHASELGFWKQNPSGVLGGLLQVIPDAAGTIVVIESTANGLRNFFREQWTRACEGKSGFTPFFFAWFEFPDYRLDLDQITEQRAELIHWHDGALDESFWQDYEEGAEDEEAVLAGLGITLEQLAWRRFAIADLCEGSIDFFHQEYPASPEQAFLSSGRPFIAPKHQTVLAKTIAPPLGIGDLTGEPIRRGKIAFQARRFGPLHVWERPNGDPHLIGADTAGGITEEEEQVRSRHEPDNCSYTVINLRTGRTVAEWSKRTDADVFGEDLARAGWIYQDREQLPAEIAVEANNMGLLTLKELRDRWFYPRIFHRESLSHEHRGARTHTIGWLTGMNNRGAMLANFSAFVRKHPEALPSARLLDQIRTFVWVTDKRVEHELGAHDDIIFGAAIAYYLFSMRSHYVGELPKVEHTAETVSELEALLDKYARKPQGRSLREQVLGKRVVRR